MNNTFAAVREHEVLALAEFGADYEAQAWFAGLGSQFPSDCELALLALSWNETIVVGDRVTVGQDGIATVD